MDPLFERLTSIEVNAVQPGQQDFTLTGQGSDAAEYQLEMHFEMPLDSRTRSVLGELLSHSGLRISRRAPLRATRVRSNS